MTKQIHQDKISLAGVGGCVGRHKDKDFRGMEFVCLFFLTQFTIIMDPVPHKDPSPLSVSINLLNS